MDLHLAGKTAVVTGASKGIGLAITQALAAEGVHVVAGARGSRRLTRWPRRPTCELVAGRSRPRRDGPAQLVDAAAATGGGLDILVNNVGAVAPRSTGSSRHRRGMGTP